MSRFGSFERIIVRKGCGYVCDETSLVKLGDLATFDTSVFKLTTKIETYLLLMSSHCSLDLFTIDVVVEENHKFRSIAGNDSTDQMMSSVWEECQAKGCHGFLTLARVDATCLPNNGSRIRYTVAQFVDSLLHGVEAYFMFQKFSPLFTLNAAGLWDAVGEMGMKSGYLILAWKMSDQPKTGRVPQRPPLTVLNPAASTLGKELPMQWTTTGREQLEQRTNLGKEHPEERITKTTTTTVTTVTTTKGGTKKTPYTPNDSQSTQPRKRGRPAKIPPPPPRESSSEEEEEEEVEEEEGGEEEEEEEEDTEITFKVQPPPVKLPEVKYSPDMSPTKTPTPPAPASAPPLEDLSNITFGFERSATPTTPGRKSTAARKSTGGRKSMLPDWPEEQKEEVLSFFDHINPKQTEQARIALACKYAAMKYDREMPSKLLYQWVQKKGRVPDLPAPGSSYDLPESKRKDAAVLLFRSLNPDLSEASRVGFTCKFFQTQYEMVLQSKQLYDMLSDKGKKTKAGGTRRR